MALCIVHGMGTGALRATLHEMLKGHPQVGGSTCNVLQHWYPKGAYFRHWIAVQQAAGFDAAARGSRGYMPGILRPCPLLCAAASSDHLS